MTANQINFAKHKEDSRHNRATEEAKLRDIAIGERQAYASEMQARTASQRQAEDARHNRESERINWFSTLQTTSEAQRHNREQEQIQWFSAQSQDRHNLESRQIASRQAEASALQARTAWESLGIQRFNAATAARQATVAEQQTAVSRRLATVQERQATVAERNASVNEYAAQTGRLSASAAQTSASAAYANALASQRQAEIRAGELGESIRRNTIQLAETQRHNQELESIERDRAASYAEQAAASTSQAQSASKRAQNDTYRTKLETADTVISGVNAASNLASSIAGIVGKFKGR